MPLHPLLFRPTCTPSTPSTPSLPLATLHTHQVDAVGTSPIILREDGMAVRRKMPVTGAARATILKPATGATSKRQGLPPAAAAAADVVSSQDVSAGDGDREEEGGGEVEREAVVASGGAVMGESPEPCLRHMVEGATAEKLHPPVTAVYVPADVR